MKIATVAAAVLGLVLSVAAPASAAVDTTGRGFETLSPCCRQAV